LQTALSQQELAELTAEERSSLRFRRALDAWLSQDWVERGARELIALGREWKLDVLLGEPFVTSAALASEALNVPYVQVGYPAAPLETRAYPMPSAWSRSRARLVGSGWWSRSTAFLVSGNLARTNAGKDATDGKDNKWNPDDDGCYH
jgi:hypothetical protein